MWLSHRKWRFTLVFAALGCFIHESMCAFQKCGSDQLSCPAQQWAKNIISYPDSWYSNPDFLSSFGLQASDGTISAMEYVANYMPCCTHCAWSLGYPKALPIVFAISPSQDTCASQSATSGTLSTCYLDCTVWSSDFSMLDLDKNGQLSSSEFNNYVTNALYAPPQLYYLYTGGRQTYSAGDSKLSSQFVLYTTDMNKDGMISPKEWLVFRHFIGPILVTRSGPSLSSSDGQSLASGPLGGLFIDTSLNEVWQSKVIFMLLDYYVSHSSLGFKSLNLREPKASEKLSVFQQTDLDGSGRLSFEEHYFQNFADQDRSGTLSPDEYYSSLYRTACSSVCPSRSCSCPACTPSSTIPAGCTSISDDAKKRLNFEIHDLDNDGNISYMERKFVAANSNFDEFLTWDEWSTADYPAYFGPWHGSLNCSSQTAVSTGTCNAMNREGYKNYMAYHYCTLQAFKLYTTFPSSYPLWSSCTVILKVLCVCFQRLLIGKVSLIWTPAHPALYFSPSPPLSSWQVRPAAPFVNVNTTKSAAATAELTSQGWLCFPPDDMDTVTRCYDGYGVQSMQTVAARLGWTLRPVLDPGTGPLLAKLGPPANMAGPSGARQLQLGLVTSVQSWRDAEWSGMAMDSVTCSQTLMYQARRDDDLRDDAMPPSAMTPSLRPRLVALLCLCDVV
jgi:hypothetical protein